MVKYTIHELPNSDCPYVHRFCHCIEQSQLTATTLLTALLSQSPSNAPVAPPQVAIAMLQRINELAASAEILLLKGRERDAAVLILCGYELQLDAMYIANDPKRADTWLDHARENKKPWSVRSQQEELFVDPDEFGAEVDNYRRYSMVKHCNPVGGLFAFPIAVSRGRMELDNSTSQRFATAHLFGLGIILLRTIRAVAKVTRKVGFVVSDTERHLTELQSSLDAVNEQSLISMLVAAGATSGSAS
jgi:hypothetical protein